EVAFDRVAAIHTLAHQLVLHLATDFGAEGSELIDLMGSFVHIAQQSHRRFIDDPVLRANEVHWVAPDFNSDHPDFHENALVTIITVPGSYSVRNSVDPRSRDESACTVRAW